MLQKLIENFREKCRAENKQGRVIVHIGPKLNIPGTEEGMQIKEGELHICFELSDRRAS